jgi:hypothetical protein
MLRITQKKNQLTDSIYISADYAESSESPILIIIIYHLELTPNSFELKMTNVLNFQFSTSWQYQPDTTCSPIGRSLNETISNELGVT